ncbi:MAG: Amuc_1102 family pilus-like protein [Chthoniobacterales bacterium]
MQRNIVLPTVAFLLAGSASAQNRGKDFQITKISRELITTPQFSYSGAEQQRETHERWLRVDVQFSAAPDFTEELTFKYYILINGKVLTGEVTHVDIVGDREHYSVMYVPPHALAHIMQGRPANATSVANVAVQIVQNGEIKDEFSLARARPQWFAELPVAPGFVLNKNETPFAPLFWDHYEQIKPIGH